MADATSPMDDTGAAPAGDDTGADAGADASQPTVLCTITQNSDGSFGLVSGDEDEGDGTDAGAAGGDDASKPQTFSDIGPLLKAIMTVLQQAQDGGAGSSQSNFDQGFSGGASASPAKSMAPAPKY